MKKSTKKRIRFFTELLEENEINTPKVRRYIAAWCMNKPFNKDAVLYMIFGLSMAKAHPHIFEDKNR